MATVISRKIIAQFTTSVLTGAAAYAVAKLGVSATLGDSAITAAVISQVAGLVAGYMVREVPELEKDLETDADKVSPELGEALSQDLPVVETTAPQAAVVDAPPVVKPRPARKPRTPKADA